MLYTFEDCELDTERYVLRRGGEPTRLEPQVFDVLACLVRNRGRLVSKEELLDEVWGTRYVSEATLTSRIRAARKAVGDSGSKQALIRTVRNRGYEFVAPVTEHATAPDETGTTPGGLPREARDLAPVDAVSPPAAVHALIGRDALLADLERELAEHRLVTLIGPGGVGKTALAYELARRVGERFADGVRIVELVRVSDAASVAQALATALDVQAHRDTSLEEAVVDMLRPRQALLVLDNCEHVVDPLAAYVDRIVQAAPGVSVVATSRQPLALRGERLWPIEPLPIGARSGEPPAAGEPVPPAIQLFAERATAADPRFALDEASLGPVTRICERLDGMPLAIELAAARVRTMGVSEIEERLGERFRLLRNVRRDGDPRHQALQDTVGWSYELLSPEEQSMFEELAVFAGPFDIRAAAAVCGDRDELDTLDLVAGLVERSMLAVRQETGTGSRYEMLETLREFGRSTLDAGAQERLGFAHASYHATLAREIEQEQRGPSEASANARAEAAFPDLGAAHRFALERGDADRALTIVGSLREFAMRSMRYEALAWAEAALECPGADEHRLFAIARGATAYGAWIRGEFDRALELALEIERGEESGGASGSGLAQRVCANVHFVQGEVEAGLEAARRQLELAEAAGEPSRIAHAAYMMAVATSSIGDTADARGLAERALAVGRSTGSPTDEACGWVALGFALHDDVSASLDAFGRCDDLARQAGNRWMSSFARTEISALQLLQGDLEPASLGLADAVDTWYRAGEWSQQWLTLASCVVALTGLDRRELAAQVLGAIERRAALGTPPVIASLRERTLAAGEELAASLGDARYVELHREGSEMPVTDVVHRTRAALRGRLPA